MKKLLTIFLTLCSLTAVSQINVYKPYRTNGNVMVADSALFIGKVKIPSYTTFSLGGYADKAGMGFGLNITNNRLNVRSNTATTLEFPTYTEIQSMISAGGSSNLALGTLTSTTVPITNSNGTGVTLPVATASLAGLVSASDQVKLNNTSGTNSGNQTLSLAATAGGVTLSGSGGTVNLLSLGNAGATIYPDANVLPTIAGLFTYITTTGATNYPADSGGGLKFVQVASSGSGYFELFKRRDASSDLSFRTGTGTSTYSAWDVVAGRTYISNLYVPLARTLTAGYGINTIGDLSTNRTVSADTTSGTALASKPRLATALALKQNLVTLTTTGTSGVATLNQGTGELNIPNYASGSSGTVTDVSSANTDIGVATGTTTPVLTLNSGTGANQIVKRDASARVTDIVPSIVQGDLLIGAGAGIMARLAKNASSTRYLSNTGTSNDPAWAQIALTTGVTGILPGVNGGTGQNNFAVGDILYASSTTNLSKRTIGGTGTVLTVSGGLPVWATPGSYPIAIKSADYALTASDYTIATGTTSTTYTLPAAASVPVGKVYMIKNFSSGSITVATTGTELKWNPASFITPVASLTGTISGWMLQTDGTYWYLITGD